MSIPLFLQNQQTGAVGINELKKYVTPWHMVPQDLGNVTGIQAVGAAGVATISLTPDQNGPFEGMYLTADALGLMNVRILDTGRNCDIMNRDVLLQTIMTLTPGGQSPFVLPETLWIEQRRTIQMTFTDLTGLANWVRPVFHGRKFWLSQARIGLAQQFLNRRRAQAQSTIPYFFTTDQAVVLAAGAVRTPAPITVDDQGHFVCYKITFHSDGPFEYRLIDGETGQSLSGNIFIDSRQAGGTARDPYILPEPWLIIKHRQLILEMNNLSALGANRVWFTMTGRRIFDGQYAGVI